MMKQSVRFTFVCALTTVLGACSLFSGSSKPKDAYDDEGRERIAVLSATQDLKADAAIAGLPVTLPRPYQNKNWAQPGGNSVHAVQHLALPDTLSQAWRTNIGRGNQAYERMITGPISADGRVFVVDVKGSVSAVALDTGRNLWTAEIKSEERSKVGFGGGVAYMDSTVFATSGYGFIVALDASTGREIWRYDAGVPFRGAPTAIGGKVYAITHDNLMMAIDAASGTLIWDQVGIAESAGMLGAASPAVDSSAVVMALSSGELVAMRPENGRILWQDSLSSSRRLTPLSTLADIDGDPVIDGGKAYALSHAGRMVAIDMRSGERSWESDIAGVSTPWIAGNFAFLTTIDGQLICMALGDGRVRWVSQLQRFLDQEKRRGLIKWNGPILAGDRLIVTSSHGYVLSVSPYSGEVISGSKLPDGTNTPPIVVDGTLVILTDNGQLVAYR